ncbi:TIGR00341 family protein [Agarivorans sp.]|uniref:TIGR00341 family protein n=1 Tax=Agarivorans sp. TaxID=1872412 RepID=UPI003D067C88
MADSFLLFETNDSELVSTKIVPLFEQVVLPKSWQQQQPPQLDANSLVYCYLSDAALARVIDVAMQQQWLVAILPHPLASNARRGFSLLSSLEAAIKDYQQAQPLAVDLLRCNQQLVLNHLVLGHSFNLRPGGHNAPWRERLKQTWLNIGKIGQIKPLKLSIETAGETRFATAVVGVVVIEHAHGSMLSKRILPETHCNDGMLESMFIAPRSIMEMCRFLLIALFGRVVRKPPFLGLIKSKSLTLNSERPFAYCLDGVENQAMHLELRCEHRKLRLLPSKTLVYQNDVVAQKESRKMGQLPEGEAVKGLAEKPLPWIAHAATEEFKELYQLLRDNARITPAFITLMILSTLLATIGLYASSAPVIIGAMILAPLMAPIISLSMALTRQDPSLTTASSFTLVVGLCVALVFATGASFIIPMELITPEIAARMSPNLLDLGVAIISGIAGAYAHARIDAAKSLAGVAIAVALVPPLAVTGIGLGWLDLSVARGAFLLFLTNLAGIVFSAAVCFLALGFAPFTRAKKGLAMALVAVTLVSVPLFFSFSRLSEEAKIVQRLQGKTFNQILLRTVQARGVEPLVLRVQLLSEDALTNRQLDELKQNIEQQLGRSVTLEASIIIRR